MKPRPIVTQKEITASARQSSFGLAALVGIVEPGGWRLSDLFGTTHDRPHDQDRRTTGIWANRLVRYSIKYFNVLYVFGYHW